MKKGFGKKALSDIVSTLLILLLVFVAIAIVWLVVRNVIKQGTEQISLGKFTLDLQIEQVSVNENSNSVNVKVKRNSGEGEFTGMKIIVSDGDNSEIFDLNESLDIYSSKVYSFNLLNVNVSNLDKVQIVPVFRLSSGKEVVGDVKDTWEKTEGSENVYSSPETTGCLSITSCISGDGCCPAGCSVNDADCAQCTSDLNCTADYNSTDYYCYLNTNNVYKTFNDYSCSGGVCVNNPTAVLVQVCNSTQTCSNGICVNNAVNQTCPGSSTQSCTITNGIGSQSRTCTNGVWSNFGTCTVVSCNSGYVISGNSCVASSCSGSSTQSCTITNGIGSQSRTCTNGVWSSWGTCTVVSCNSGYVISGNSCVVQSSSGDFTIYNSWNFENEGLGSYTDSEIREDFNYTILYSHNSANIVSDIINGQQTKVLRITHEANKVSVGFEMNVDLKHDYNEVYLNYNWKFNNEFDSTAGGKMPGLGGLPDFSNVCPTSGQGFRAHSLFKQAGRLYSYHYDRTTGSCPWSVEYYNFNQVYLNNGQWYSITQRLVMNTFTNGVPNRDGIKELWVDGRLVFQETNLLFMENEAENFKIDAFRLANFYGGDISYAPLNEGYGYIDNIKVYMPKNDPVSGHGLHSPSTILNHPDMITNRTVYYDYLRTTSGTFSNSQYGSTYSQCLDEAWLIDAGAGKRVSFTINGGHIGHDFLFIYDGDKSDSNMIKLINDAGLSGTYTSTGRYMFVRFSTTKGSGSTGWTGTLNFI